MIYFFAVAEDIPYSSLASKANSKESVESVSEMFKERYSPYGFGLTSNKGERIHPFSDNRNPWFLRWSSVLDTRMLNTIRFQSSTRSFLGFAPADLIKEASLYIRNCFRHPYRQGVPLPK